MKTRIIAVTAASFLAISGIFFTACQRERDQDTTDGAEQTLMERNADDAIAISEEAFTGQVGQFKKERGCATVTIDTLSSPKKVTIDFGAANCLCLDGKNRRGKIIRTYTSNLNVVGTIHTITYMDYFVDDNALKGTKTIINNGVNSKNNISYTINVKDTLLQPGAGNPTTWQSNRVREWIAGNGDAVWSNDEFKVTGTASGVKPTGYTWAANITQPLYIKNNCKYRIVQGTVEIQPQGKSLRTLDYGTGACDNQATIQINNNVWTIAIK